MQMDLFDQLLASLFGRKKSGSVNPSPDKSGKKQIVPNDIPKTISLSGQQIDYTLRRSTRRSIGFLISETGLRVTAPKKSSLHSIELAIIEKQRWILSKLAYYRFYQPAKTDPIVWKNGSLLPFLGHELPLEIISGTEKTPVLKVENNTLLIYQLDNTTALDVLLKDGLMKHAGEILSQRLRLQAARMNIQFNAFGLTNARTRWGSCSVKRHIRLNWRLVHCDISLIDYVVIHELAHCLEMNHSQRFWNIVARYYPDYKNARKQLHKQSASLFSLFRKQDI